MAKIEGKVVAIEPSGNLRTDISGDRLRGAPTDDRRLILFGHGNFRARHEKLHAWMAERGVKHLNVDGPTRPHVWSSGWLPEAFDLILTDLPPAPKPNE